MEDRPYDGIAVWNRVPPTRDGLRRLRRRAVRFNAWFRLKWGERRYMDAVIRVVDVVRSPLLLRLVGAIVKKLLDTLRGAGADLAFMIETVGKPLAKKLSLMACRWGHRTAAGWVKDPGFLTYLTVMHVNEPLALA